MFNDFVITFYKWCSFESVGSGSQTASCGEIAVEVTINYILPKQVFRVKKNRNIFPYHYYTLIYIYLPINCY